MHSKLTAGLKALERDAQRIAAFHIGRSSRLDTAEGAAQIACGPLFSLSFTGQLLDPGLASQGFKRACCLTPWEISGAAM